MVGFKQYDSMDTKEFVLGLVLVQTLSGIDGVLHAAGNIEVEG